MSSSLLRNRNGRSNIPLWLRRSVANTNDQARRPLRGQRRRHQVLSSFRSFSFFAFFLFFSFLELVKVQVKVEAVHEKPKISSDGKAIVKLRRTTTTRGKRPMISLVLSPSAFILPRLVNASSPCLPPSLSHLIIVAHILYRKTKHSQGRSSSNEDAQVRRDGDLEYREELLR